MGAAKNQGVQPFTNHVGHFGAPWRPSWIFDVLVEGMIVSNKLGLSWDKLGLDFNFLQIWFNSIGWIDLVL